MTVLAQRRFTVASVLSIAGCLFYVGLSEASPQLRLLTIVQQLLLLSSSSYAAWAGRSGAGPRLVALLAITGLGAAAFTYVDSHFIAALNPLHGAYFLSSFGALVLEVFAFVAIVHYLVRIWNGLGPPKPGAARPGL